MNVEILRKKQKKVIIIINEDTFFRLIYINTDKKQQATLSIGIKNILLYISSIPTMGKKNNKQQ